MNTRLDYPVFPDAPTLNFPLTADAFLQWRGPGACTRKTYASVFRLFYGWARALEPSLPFGPAVRAWVHHLIASGKKAATVEVHAVALRQLGHYLVREGILAEGVEEDLGLPAPESVVYQRGALSKRQARSLLDLAGSDTTKQKRNQAVLALMARAGLRSCEVVRAKLHDIQVQDGAVVLWVQGKGKLSADSFVVLNEKAREALADYLATRGPALGSDPLIAALDPAQKGPITERQIQRMMTGCLRQAELKSERITVHSLRHTAASLAIAAGAPLTSVQRMLRHEDLRTTTRYVHMRRKLSRAAETALDF